jgi:hypothetical protein
MLRRGEAVPEEVEPLEYGREGRDASSIFGLILDNARLMDMLTGGDLWIETGHELEEGEKKEGGRRIKTEGKD